MRPERREKDAKGTPRLESAWGREERLIRALSRSAQRITISLPFVPCSTVMELAPVYSWWEAPFSPGTGTTDSSSHTPSRRAMYTPQSTGVRLSYRGSNSHSPSCRSRPYLPSSFTRATPREKSEASSNRRGMDTIPEALT